MNDYSLNETASYTRLAAKGVGYPWGLADEVYRSVFWLVQHNFPAPLMVRQLLSHYQSPKAVEQSMPSITGSHYQSRGRWLCPVMIGCAMSDHVDDLDKDTSITIDELKYPLLLLPFIAEMAVRFDGVIKLELDSHVMATDGECAHFSSASVVQLDHVKTTKLTLVSKTDFTFDQSETLEKYNRVNVDSETWDSLAACAHHTYAPATDASRNSGAGAGTTDND